MKSVFSNSLLLHILLGLLIAIVLESLTPVLFSGFLNIPLDREHAAKCIYQLVVIMVYISFVSAPYRALLISRENIIYTSVIDVIDGILKVGLVLIIPILNLDNLIVYGCIMFLLAVLIYCPFPYILIDIMKNASILSCGILIGAIYEIYFHSQGGLPIQLFALPYEHKVCNSTKQIIGSNYKCRIWYWWTGI